MTSSTFFSTCKKNSTAYFLSSSTTKKRWEKINSTTWQAVRFFQHAKETVLLTSWQAVQQQKRQEKINSTTWQAVRFFQQNDQNDVKKTVLLAPEPEIAVRFKNDKWQWQREWTASFGHAADQISVQIPWMKVGHKFWQECSDEVCSYWTVNGLCVQMHVVRCVQLLDGGKNWVFSKGYTRSSNLGCSFICSTPTIIF